jgi:predicted nucleic acid-binding protein
VYLIDTDVVSEARKGDDANMGVRSFFADATRDNTARYLSAITVGELRQGVEMIRHRRDEVQARRLDRWLARVTSDDADAILPIDYETAEVWGRLRARHADRR